MNLRELDPGDVFVLRWWLDVGPVARRYLVVKRDGGRLSVLRLDEAFSKLSEIDDDLFESSVLNGDVVLVEVIRRASTTPH